MSLLADLLSKVKPASPGRDIPPNLKNIVHTSVKRSAYKRKIIFISVFLAVSIMSGILVIYYVRNLSGISGKEVDMGTLPGPSIGVEGKPQSVSRAGSDQAVDTSTEVVAKADKQIRTPSLELKEETDKQLTDYPKSALQESSAEKIKVEEPVKTEEGSLTAHTEVERTDVFERDALLYAARDYELKKDYSKALSIYKKILEMDKDNITVMNNIAYILLYFNLIEESIKYSQMAVDINNDYVPALINLGVAYTKHGDIAAAEGYLKRAFTLEPDNKSVILNLAIFYEKQKDNDTASKHYTKLIHLGDIGGYLGLARVYEKEGRIEEGLKIYKSIYSLDSIDDKTRIMVNQRVNILNERLRMKTEN